MPVVRPTKPGLPAAIQRYFDVALYLLVLTGAGTLASTGTLGFPTLLFVGSAMLFRGYLLAEKRTLIIPLRWTSLLTVAYVIFYLVDYLLISRAFLGSTVHLVLFVMVVRLFSAPRDRDQYLLMVISFLMVLAAAILTVDSVFVLTFTAFIFMAIVSCILMEMKRACGKAAFQSANPPGALAHRRMVFSIVRVVPGLVLLIALGGSGIFFLLPRMAGSYLGTFSGGSDLSTGFSDHVELGGIGRIQQSNAVAMHIAIDGDKAGGFDLKWRGISLNVFDGRTWSDSHAKYVMPPQAGGGFALRSASGSSSVTGPTIHYHVLMEPMGSAVFFLAPTARLLQGHYRIVTEDAGGAIFDEDADHTVNQYDATSSIGVPVPATLRSASETYPAQLVSEYGHVPQLDPRIPELARQITSQKENNYDRAVALENYLRSHFGYTLQLSRARVQDPLADFLFVRKQGHCEYFASSMAIMLRTLGIPSRVVNGFRTGEFNDLTSQYLVRESDAHSWVEAYFPGSGWVSFDPTPPGANEPRTGWNRASLYLDAMASFWREWVVSYDYGHQISLGHVATRDSMQLVQHARQWFASKYDRMLSAADRTRTEFSARPKRWRLLGLLAAVAIVFVSGATPWSRFLARAKLAANPAQSPRSSASLWYGRMLRRVGREGWHKMPEQTPTEFLCVIPARPVREHVAKFTRVYESARFGGSAEDASSLPKLYEEIEDALTAK